MLKMSFKSTSVEFYIFIMLTMPVEATFVERNC